MRALWCSALWAAGVLIVSASAAFAQNGRAGDLFNPGQGALQLQDDVERAQRACVNESGRYSVRRSIAACSELVSFARNSGRYTYSQLRFHVGDRDGEAYALFLRGNAYMRGGNGREAVRDFDVALAIVANDPFVLFFRCQARMMIDDLDGALADCTLSMEQEPSAEAAVARGAARIRRGEYDDAIADFESASAALPGYALYGRGLARVGLGQSDLAVADLETPAAQDPAVRSWFARLGLAVDEAPTP
jgi:tetratricopeptide (TPR) repeat protein